MIERLTGSVENLGLRFLGIERRVDEGPREWLEGVAKLIGKAERSVQMVIDNVEFWVLARALNEEEIPETWREVQTMMVEEKSAGKQDQTSSS